VGDLEKTSLPRELSGLRWRPHPIEWGLLAVVVVLQRLVMWRDLQTSLPRIAELARESQERGGTRDYFTGLAYDIQNVAHAREYYLGLESELSMLDSVAWALLKRKCLHYASECSPDRGWAQLIATLNEAKGYCLLLHLGMSSVEFVEEGKLPSPDVRGWNEAQLIHVEVKTVEKSDEAISRQHVLGSGTATFHALREDYELGLRRKLAQTLSRADVQLGAASRRIALLVIHPDLWTPGHSDNELQASLHDVRPGDLEVVFEVRGVQATLLPRVRTNAADDLVRGAQ
jgi:hypothetical protein